MSIDKRLISTGGPAVCTADTLDIFGDSSCVALYGLNYDGSDAGGNYDGTPSNVDFNSPGYIDYAASFNGSSSSVSVTTTSTTPVDFSARSYSLSVWVNTTSTTASALLSKYGDSDAARSFTLLLQANGTIRHYERSSGTFTQTDSTATVNDGNWHHVVVTKSSTQTTIYIDNAATINNNTFTSNNGGTEPFRIGRDNPGSPEWFNGKIDQVRIFNKALSAAEVTTLYGEVACEYTCTTDTNGFPATASSDLVAYYQLDNDATDDTGSYNGTASSVTFDGGRYGSSAVFNGSNSYISTPALGLVGDVAYSISAWVFLNTSSQTSGIYVIWDGTATVGRHIFFKVQSGALSIGNYGASITASTSIPTNQWSNVVVSREVGGSTTLYVNGASVATGSMSLNLINNTGKIGTVNGSAEMFNGKIDQVRIYDKALSSTEVSSLYEDEHQCYITVDSTDPFGDSSNIALYEFENNANDSTGSYNGTASNVTYSTDSIIGTYSASFNGSSSYIDTNYTLPADSTYSISLWFNTTYTGTYNTILSDHPSNGAAVGSRIYFGIINGSTFNILLANGSTFWTDNTVNISSYVDGNWHNINLTLDGTSVKLYIDGDLINTYTSTVSAGTAGSQSIVLGRLGDYNGEYFNGSIDQVRIFDRQLNGDEVWKLYAEGAKG
jgi:hypothetical protein